MEERREVGKEGGGKEGGGKEGGGKEREERERTGGRREGKEGREGGRKEGRWREDGGRMEGGWNEGGWREKEVEKKDGEVSHSVKPITHQRRVVLRSDSLDYFSDPREVSLSAGILTVAQRRIGKDGHRESEVLSCCQPSPENERNRVENDFLLLYEFLRVYNRITQWWSAELKPEF